jgi:hypothetical protein
MFDGTMPDTPENQQAYPQLYNRKPGLGFPIARIGAITSLPPPRNLCIGRDAVCRRVTPGSARPGVTDERRKRR